MSITAGLPRIQDKGNQKSFHQRHNSGELDVFEAAGYFSGSNEINGTRPKMMRPSARMSLDIPVMSSKRSSIPALTHHEKVAKDEKKFKQPNSPGGKLASFLNSLFNQTSSKTKKSKISSSQTMKDDQDHEMGRRKRRSSISHIRSVNATSSNCNSSDNSKSSSFYSSSSSSEKRPISSAKNMSFKEFQSHSDHNPDMTMSSLSKIKNNINVHTKSSSSSQRKVHTNESTENSWLDEEKFRFRTPNENSSEKYNNTLVNAVSGDKVNHSKDSTNFIKFINDADDGADSDSSSDLFELQNYDFVSCDSSDLPVFETTHIDAIKRGAPIVSGAM